MLTSGYALGGKKRLRREGKSCHTVATTGVEVAYSLLVGGCGDRYVVFPTICGNGAALASHVCYNKKLDRIDGQAQIGAST
jgi:hypothetical protein